MDGLARPIGELFARQEGLATLAQLRQIGVTRGVLRNRLEKEEWQRVSRTVVASLAIPWTWHRRVRAAWLDAGDSAAISHPTACRLHCFDGCDQESEIHVATFGGRHHTSIEGVVVHRSQLAAKECVMVDGIRVVSRPLALIQLAGCRSSDAAAKALDGMLRSGDPIKWIEQVARSRKRQGVRGASVVLDLLKPRMDGRLPRSWFQRLSSRVLASHRVHFVDEHPVKDPVTGRELAQLDLALPDLMIGVECQSWEWHGSPSAQIRDARRKRRLRLLGWEIVDVWWTDLRRMDEIVAEVRYLIDRRRAGSLP